LGWSRHPEQQSLGHPHTQIRSLPSPIKHRRLTWYAESFHAQAFAVSSFSGLAVTSLGAFAATDAAPCKSIRLADLGWADNAANNGVTMAVAESLGYSLARPWSPCQSLASIQAGKLDAFLDYWSPSLDPTVMPLVNEGSFSSNSRQT
jgi:ABC-type proline/glycine betaine transport system substrate-binding protein